MATAKPTKAFVGKVYLAVGDGASPEVFTRYTEIDTMANIGVKNDLVEVTTFDNEGSKVWIGGLSDGKEITFGANYAIGEPVQEGLMADVDAKNIRNFEVQVGGTSPMKKFSLSLTMLDWDMTPSVAKQNVIKFIGKITGPIVRT